MKQTPHIFEPWSKSFWKKCDYCNNVLFPGPCKRCSICHLKVHLIECVEATDLKNCYYVLSVDVIKKMTAKKRKRAVDFLGKKMKERILNTEDIQLLCNLLLFDENIEIIYDIFEGKKILKKCHLELDTLFYDPIMTLNSTSLLLLQILVQLSNLESNCKKIIRDSNFFVKVAGPLLDIKGDQFNVENLTRALMVSKILKNMAYNSSNRKYLIENQIFYKFVNLMKECDTQIKQLKIEINKDKKIRELRRKILKEGAEFIDGYFFSFYQPAVNNMIITLICETGLSLLLDAICYNKMEPKCPLYTKIDPEAIKLGENPVEISTSEKTIVYKGEYNGKTVAVKVVLCQKAHFNEPDFLREVTLLSLTKHPNVCSMYGVSTGSEYSPNQILSNPFIVMPYFIRSLEDHLKTLKETHNSPESPVIDFHTLLRMAVDMAKAVFYLHSRSIIHRDLKPGNFLLTENDRVVVCDLGVSRALPDSAPSSMSIIGTDYYMAPEVLDAKSYNTKADTYSFALVLWAMLTGQTRPYWEENENNNQKKMIHKIVYENYRLEIPSYTPVALRNFIVSCWDPNPERRPTFDKIIETIPQISLDPDNAPNPNFFKIYDQLSPYLDTYSQIQLSQTCFQFNLRIVSLDHPALPTPHWDNFITPRSPRSKKKNRNRVSKLSSL